MLRVIFTVITIFIILLPGCSISNGEQPADLVIKNAKIVTIDKKNPRAEAVAIRGEVIVAVTSNSEITKYIKEGATKVIDAKGRLVIPGFNDAHIHFAPLDTDYIELRYITDPNVITEKVKERVGKVKPGELIRGGHFEHEMFIDKKWPTKELIDKVAPDNPVVLSRADGHSVLVNSYVIKRSGITKDTPDPFGGEIQKDPVTGEPTGIFKEAAKSILKYGATSVERTPEEKKAKLSEGWLAALKMAAGYGVTSIQHAGRGDPVLYNEMMDNEKLTLRVDVSGTLTDDVKELEKYKKMRNQYPTEGNWIRFGYLKGFIDGTLGSGTMMVFKPFDDAPDKTGLPQMPYDELEKKVLASDKAGFQIGIHAIGPKANRWILNAYEKAMKVNGKRDSRHRSEHAQILVQEDIPRFHELEVIASMQPTHCITDKRFCEKRIGHERSKGAYAWRSLLNEKTKLAFGTDYSVEPINPMEGLYAAVTRKDRLGEKGDGWFPEQKLTMEEAIELYTLGSAYAQFMEDRKGMIKKGYLADMVILNQDLMTIPHDQIMESKVDCTIVGGKIIFKRKDA